MSDESNLSPDDLATVFASFVRQVAAAADRTSPLLQQLREHLGADPASLPVTEEQFDSFEQPNLQVALDSYLAGEGRSARLAGVSMENKRFMAVGLSEMASWGGSPMRMPLMEGPVDQVNFHLEAGRVLACVQFGLYLISDGDARLTALVAGPSYMGDPRRQKLRLEVMCAREEDAAAFIERVRELMDRLNVYRGQVVSISAMPIQLGPGPVTLVQFERLPAVAREDVVLPEGVLDRIERHTITFSRHAEALLKAGRSLKRGLLLHGLPGTGKTLTVMYLAGRLPGRTVILTSGRGLGMIQTVAQLARRLSPSMVVLEDVDLVAEERTMPGFGARPVLFELLNELDGLRDDQDVIFVLTTNRPDVLEPALAARPGRVDVVVELPLPDGGDRRRLVELYARGLTLDDVDVGALVERIDGATPAYIKEVMRKAAVFAAEAGSAASIRQEHIDGALDELAQGGRLAERILGFRPEPPSAQARPGVPPGMPTGFPAAQVFIRRDE
jgi:ATPase family associated with various cellular activities (AAA)